MLVQTQNTYNWLTPFADAKFEDGKIVYTFNASPDMAVSKIKPLYFSQSLMILKPGLNMPTLNPSDVARQQQKIREYLIEEDVTNLNTTEQTEYLRLSAMVLIWDMGLEPSVLKSISNLKSTDNSQIQKQSELVWKLKDVYESL